MSDEKTIVPLVKALLRWFQKNPILSFVATVILSAGVGLLVTSASQRNVSILVIAVSILVLFTVTSMNRATESIVSLVKSPPFVGFTAYGENQVAEAFTNSIEALHGSTNHIVVLAGVVPKPDNLVQPKMPITRASYLQKIEETIKEKLADQGTTHYTYKRVLQSFVLPLTETLRKDQVDLAMFEHCREIFRILSQSSTSAKINFELVIREPTYLVPRF